MLKKIQYIGIVTLLFITIFSVKSYAIGNMSNWAVSEISEAKEMGLIENDLQWDYQGNITRKEFAKLMVSLYEILKGEVLLQRQTPFFDIDDDYVSTAYALGLIKGVGNNRFAPKQDITREEMAVMMNNLITRLYNKKAAK